LPPRVKCRYVGPRSRTPRLPRLGRSESQRCQHDITHFQSRHDGFKLRDRSLEISGHDLMEFRKSRGRADWTHTGGFSCKWRADEWAVSIPDSMKGCGLAQEELPGEVGLRATLNHADIEGELNYTAANPGLICCRLYLVRISFRSCCIWPDSCVLGETEIS
jgi:hypothetical protein